MGSPNRFTRKPEQRINRVPGRGLRNDHLVVTGVITTQWAEPLNGCKSARKLADQLGCLVWGLGVIPNPQNRLNPYAVKLVQGLGTQTPVQYLRPEPTNKMLKSCLKDQGIQINRYVHVFVSLSATTNGILLLLLVMQTPLRRPFPNLTAGHKVETQRLTHGRRLFFGTRRLRLACATSVANT